MQLEKMNLRELDVQELKSVEGGISPIAIGVGLALAATFLIGAYNGYNDTKNESK